MRSPIWLRLISDVPPAIDMPRAVVERALAVLPDVDLVNAYGLTETSSTIAVLGPDDHRTAFASDDADVRARLGSVGQVLPGVELTIRDPDGQPVAASIGAKPPASASRCSSPRSSASSRPACCS